jgi:hypothetical protein
MSRNRRQKLQDKALFIWSWETHPESGLDHEGEGLAESPAEAKSKGEQSMRDVLGEAVQRVLLKEGGEGGLVYYGIDSQGAPLVRLVINEADESDMLDLQFIMARPKPFSFDQTQEMWVGEMAEANPYARRNVAASTLMAVSTYAPILLKLAKKLGEKKWNHLLSLPVEERAKELFKLSRRFQWINPGLAIPATMMRKLGPFKKKRAALNRKLWMEMAKKMDDPQVQAAAREAGSLAMEAGSAALAAKMGGGGSSEMKQVVAQAALQKLAANNPDLPSMALIRKHVEEGLLSSGICRLRPAPWPTEQGLKCLCRMVRDAYVQGRADDLREYAFAVGQNFGRDIYRAVTGVPRAQSTRVCRTADASGMKAQTVFFSQAQEEFTPEFEKLYRKAENTLTHYRESQLEQLVLLHERYFSVRGRKATQEEMSQAYPTIDKDTVDRKISRGRILLEKLGASVELRNFLKRGRPPGVALDGEKERAARRKRERRRAERSGTKENPSTYEVAYTIYSYHGGKIGSKAELFGSAEEVRQWWHRARRDIDVRVQWAKKDGKFISFADLLFRR